MIVRYRVSVSPAGNALSVRPVFYHAAINGLGEAPVEEIHIRGHSAHLYKLPLNRALE